MKKILGTTKRISTIVKGPNLTDIISIIRHYFKNASSIPLHTPNLDENDQKAVFEVVGTSYVSSIGEAVSNFGSAIAEFTSAEAAVPLSSGTAALHAAMHLANVSEGDYVITQPLSFVATTNAILYCHAKPIFIDIDKSTLGLCPHALENWLTKYAFVDDQSVCRFKRDRKIIKACVPMHTFGHAVKIDLIAAVCDKWCLSLIEDCAESLGTFVSGKHTGTFGRFGTLSFNGNKIITTGGGGAILCKREDLDIVRHVTSTAKIPHKIEFEHDMMGFNYRMPNLNAALGIAQIGKLPRLLKEKRKLAEYYRKELEGSEFLFVDEPTGTESNFWLNSVLCPTPQARNSLLAETNKAGIQARPAWKLLSRLDYLKHYPRDNLANAIYMSERLVNLPSTPMFWKV